MVGLGGGFVLVPILRLFLGFSPADAAGTSLVLIVANSASGAFTYLLQRRVHLKIGWLIAAGGLPGSILGAIASVHISPRLFDTILAILLVGVADRHGLERRAAGWPGRPEHHRVSRNQRHVVSRGARTWDSSSASFRVSSGSGGGIVLVPTFLYFSELPAHAISATSHFAILLTSPVGLVVAHRAARHRRRATSFRSSPAACSADRSARASRCG